MTNKSFGILQLTRTDTQTLLAAWRRLQRQQPDICRFITAYSYRQAPTDPVARQEIARGMTAMFEYLDTLEAQNVIRTMFGGLATDISPVT